MFAAFKCFERFEEPGMISEDFQRVRWGWGNWHQLPAPVILVNNTWITESNYSVDFPSGVVSFNTPLNPGDDVRASYNMRLFPLSLISQFIPYTMSEINLRKPQSNWTPDGAPDKYFATMVLGIYVKMIEVLILKLGLFRWRRLFQEPASIETQLRANLEDARADYQTLLATTKRRGDATPAAVASFNVGRNGSNWMTNEINFQQFVIAR